MLSRQCHSWPLPLPAGQLIPQHTLAPVMFYKFTLSLGFPPKEAMLVHPCGRGKSCAPAPCPTSSALLGLGSQPSGQWGCSGHGQCHQLGNGASVHQAPHSHLPKGGEEGGHQIPAAKSSSPPLASSSPLWDQSQAIPLGSLGNLCSAGSQWQNHEKQA